MKKSVWSDSVTLPHFDKLCGDIKTDVLIIGGGICGVLCAYFLKQAGVDCVLVEAKRICQGVTQNTTAKITAQHGLIYAELIEKFGKETAQKYLSVNQQAIENFCELCKNIDCDFSRLSAYTYSRNNSRKIEREVRAINSLGGTAEYESMTPLPFKIAGAVRVNNQAQFNPLKFVAAIVKDLNIYENTMVQQVNGTTAFCDNGKISAKKIIVATHFPFINKHGNYFLKLYQHRSYVLALENAQDVDGMYMDETEDGFSFRNSGNLLLLGGCGARTGKSCGNWEELSDFKKRYYPKSDVKYRWATQDCITLDKIPYIGQYSAKTPNLFVATGFNKWGMTSSMVSAMLLCDMIQNIKNDYADVFSPQRSILKPQLFVNGFETLSNFVLPTTKRCPHLGCALLWNKAEHSWDCSCHGSRFDKDGNLINNPATKNADSVK